MLNSRVLLQESEYFLRSNGQAEHPQPNRVVQRVCDRGRGRDANNFADALGAEGTLGRRMFYGDGNYLRAV